MTCACATTPDDCCGCCCCEGAVEADSGAGTGSGTTPAPPAPIVARTGEQLYTVAPKPKETKNKGELLVAVTSKPGLQLRNQGEILVPTTMKPSLVLKNQGVQLSPVVTKGPNAEPVGEYIAPTRPVPGMEVVKKGRDVRAEEKEARAGAEASPNKPGIRRVPDKGDKTETVVSAASSPPEDAPPGSDLPPGPPTEDDEGPEAVFTGFVDLSELLTLDRVDRARVRLRCGLPSESAGGIEVSLAGTRGVGGRNVYANPLRAGPPSVAGQLQRMTTLSLGTAGFAGAPVQVRTSVPLGYRVDYRLSETDRRDVFEKLLPAFWQDRIAANVPDYAGRFAGLDLRDVSVDGLFWSDGAGYLRNALALGVQVVDLASEWISQGRTAGLAPGPAGSLASQILDPCGFYPSDGFRAWLRQRYWKIAWDDLHSTPKSAGLALAIASDGHPYLIRTSDHTEKAVAFAFINRVRIATPFLGEAALADFYFWWAWRLLDYTRCRARTLGIAERDYLVPDVPGVEASHAGEFPDLLAWVVSRPRRAQALAWDMLIAKLAARLGLVSVSTSGGLIAHEMGHLSGWTGELSRKQGASPYHCDGPLPWQRSNCCTDVAEFGTIHTAIARYGLPRPHTTSVGGSRSATLAELIGRSRLHVGDWRPAFDPPNGFANATDARPWGWRVPPREFYLAGDAVGVGCGSSGGHVSAVHHGLLAPNHQVDIRVIVPTRCVFNYSAQSVVSPSEMHALNQSRELGMPLATTRSDFTEWMRRVDWSWP